MLKGKRIDEIVDFLSKRGAEIVRRQLEKKTYTHRSLNLHDSYGWGVYVNKQLKAHGAEDPKANVGKKWKGEIIKGSDAINTFLKSEYSPHSGIELIVVAAMPYADIVESKYKYNVVATAREEMRELSKEIKGAMFGIIKNGRY